MVIKVSPRALDALGTLVRLGLAAVWLVAGGIKAADPAHTYAAVQAYQLLPAGVVTTVAAVVPFVEIGLGLLLVSGVGTRLVAGLSALVLGALMVAVSQAWARGLAIDCGCFGGGGPVTADQAGYGWQLARDSGFLLLAAWLLVRPISYLTLDRHRPTPSTSGVGDQGGE
ncbi:MAG: DoxX family membrane protein [Pseudonocardiales bacterium]|nr:DoxX family membrane protein [Pseudonocardiales bacterium]